MNKKNKTVKAPKAPLQRVNAVAQPFALLHRQIDDLFDAFNRDIFADRWPFARADSRMPSIVNPKFEVSETDSAFEVAAELPGMDEKDIEVTLDENLLVIKGEKRRENTANTKQYHVEERTYGSFQRVIPVPAGADRDSIAADFKKGILHVHLPKKGGEQAGHRKVAIKAG